MGNKSTVRHLSRALFKTTPLCLSVQPDARNADYSGWQTQITHRLAAVRQRCWKAGICRSVFKEPHNLTNLHTAPYGCCRHLKMAVAKPITANWANHSEPHAFTHNSNFSLVCSLSGELWGSVCVCVDKWDGLFAYAALKTVVVYHVNKRKNRRIRIREEEA